MGPSSPWLDLAKTYLGQHEILGSKDNQFILDCFKHTGYKAEHDEVPWCAAFICRLMDETKQKSSHSAAALSYAQPTWGTKCELTPGAIVVFKWASGGQHVAIVHHIVDATHVACIGGNQSDMVKISVFPRSCVYSTRWPVAL
jgi:uncharacterized protein (TIGR02594 family)